MCWPNPLLIFNKTCIRIYKWILICLIFLIVWMSVDFQMTKTLSCVHFNYVTNILLCPHSFCYAVFNIYKIEKCISRFGFVLVPHLTFTVLLLLQWFTIIYNICKIDLFNIPTWSYNFNWFVIRVDLSILSVQVH